MKVERHVTELMEEGEFRKSMSNQVFHKNMFFGLAYLHSVLDGRAAYGTLGWNVQREFDGNDFKISNQMLYNHMRKPIAETL